jgi:hypothetical protein
VCHRKVEEMDVRAQSIDSSLEAADEWERKGRACESSQCLEDALIYSLSLSVTECARLAEGVAWLESQGIRGHLERYRRALGTLAAEVDSGKQPPHALSGQYHYLAFSHLGWLIRDFEAGEWLAGIAGRPDTSRLSSPFWREYQEAIAKLIRGEPYEPKPLRKLRGLERHWATYLGLIQAATHGAPLEPTLAAIDESFAARNADHRLRDSYDVEGTGRQPAKWDFRKESLLMYVAHKHDG